MRHRISFPPEEPNEGYNYFSFERILHMGFHRNEEKRRYEYLYDIDSFSNSIFLKTLVARIVFEVFAGWEIDNPAHIEITI